MPPNGSKNPRTVSQLESIVKQWSRLAGMEWQMRRVEPNLVYYPGRPQLNDSKPQMQFISMPKDSLLRRIAQSPVVLLGGLDAYAKARAKRIALKRPTNYYNVPLAQRVGPTNTFGKGAGMGIPQPMEPPPNFNPDDNTPEMRKVRFIEKQKNMRPVRKVHQEIESLPGPRKSILRRR